ncbi:hypothetical protein V2G26_007992 [Clonostachys chloroleuca]
MTYRAIPYGSGDSRPIHPCFDVAKLPSWETLDIQEYVNYYSVTQPIRSSAEQSISSICPWIKRGMSDNGSECDRE